MLLGYLPVSETFPKGIVIQDLTLGHQGATVLTDKMWRDFMLQNVNRNVLYWESNLPNAQTMLIKLVSNLFLWVPEHMETIILLVQPLRREIVTNVMQLSTQNCNDQIYQICLYDKQRISHFFPLLIVVMVSACVCRNLEGSRSNIAQ